MVNEKIKQGKVTGAVGIGFNFLPGDQVKPYCEAHK